MAETILIVDDDPDSVDIVQTFLKSQGYDVHAARDGRAGLAKIEEVDPALVLLDVMMPGMDGWEVARVIKSHPDHADTRVVMLTARSGSADRRESFRSGADDYIVKPIRLDDLATRIERNLEARPGPS